MTSSTILALSSKPAHTWTNDEVHQASVLLALTPEPLPEPYINLLFALGEAEEAMLYRHGATRADLED
jgi:hypothetical protein